LKVLLINANAVHVEQKAAIPLGLLSIATYLDSHGHTVEIVDRVFERGSLRKRLERFCPDIAGISAIGIESFPDAVKVSEALKKRNIPVVWGGHMPSLIPEVVLQTPPVDFVVMGEGEITMLALLDAIALDKPLSEVDGLAYRENGDIKVNRPRSYADLAQLPVIDWHYVDPKKYFIRNVSSNKTLHVYSSKGCPGKCTYCYSPNYSSCTWRERPAGYFLQEIRYLVDTYGIDGVFFADDLLSPNRNHLRSLCADIKKSGIRFVWGCDLRVDSLSREDLQMMYDAGCRWIFFGIESGSPARQTAIRKMTNLLKAKETIDACKEIGIVTTTSFIIGFPGETEAELRETATFLARLRSDIKLAFYFYPVPNSQLFAQLVAEGQFKAPATMREWMRYPKLNRLTKNFSQVPDRDLKVVCSYFLWQSIFKKYRDYGGNSRVIAKKAFGQTLENLLRRTPRSLRKVGAAAREFIGVAYYMLMFPGTRKKYGLTTAREHHSGR